MIATSKRRQIETTRPKETDSALFEEICGSKIKHLNNILSNYTCTFSADIYLRTRHFTWTILINSSNL